MWNFVIMKANRIFLLFLVMAWMIILLSPALSHAKKETLVVMDLKPVGVGKNEAFILTERVRAAISKTRKFILVSREEMENIAKEQRFQVSDQCDSTSCYAEIGGALGAKKMVAGSVGKIGKTFTLTLKLIDIAKVKDVRTVNKDFSGEIDKFLPYVDQAGAELMGVVTAPIGGAGAPSIMPGVYKEDFSKLKRDVSKGVGSLYIKTVPAGAKVTINGVEQDGISPVTVNDLYEGEYIVEAVKGNYALRKKIEIKAMKYNKFTLELEHLTASLNIISEPAEARVYLDGEYKGETPLIIPKVHTGTHTIKIVKRSYFSLEQKLNITASSFEPKRFKLHQAAYLTVTSTPDQAKVIVGERELGKTPVELIFLPGEYAVKVEKDDFISQEKKVALKFGQKEILDFTLNNIYTKCQIESNPSGATVYINGKKMKYQTPLSVGLKEGEHNLKILLNEFHPIEETVKVVLGNASTYKYDFKSKYGQVIINKVRPKQAQIYLEDKLLKREKECKSVSDYHGTSKECQLKYKPLKLLAGKKYQFKASSRGYLTQKFSLEIKPGQTEYLKVNLKESPLLSRYREDKLFHHGWGAVFSVATAALAGGGGYLFYLSGQKKNEADEQDKLFQAASTNAEGIEYRNERDSLADSASKYRIYSITSFGLAGATLAGAIYYFATTPANPFGQLAKHKNIPDWPDNDNDKKFNLVLAPGGFSWKMEF